MAPCALFSEADTSASSLEVPGNEGLFVLGGAEKLSAMPWHVIREAAEQESADALAKQWFDRSGTPVGSQCGFIAKNRETR